jgi:uncharacterized protein involved in exopolysaccharide biosynthesis
VDREITLRDYGRVLWTGRWLILATTVVAAIAGLLLSIASTTTYTASAELFVGQATTVSGTPVATPDTNPGTVTTALGGDGIVAKVAKELGISPSRVRGDVTLSAPKAPGGSVGNQPTIVTIQFADEDREIARKGANAYAQIVYERSQEGFTGILNSYERAVAVAAANVADLEASLARYRRQLAATDDPQQQVILESLLSSTGQQLNIAATELSSQRLNLLKEQQFQPSIISLATNPTSSGSVGNRTRTVVFAAILGFLVGVIVTFIWRGSPAGRAGRD